ELSTEISGIVTELVKAEGERVELGDLILRLDAEQENLQLASTRQDLLSQQSRVLAAVAEVQQYRASPKEIDEDLAITTIRADSDVRQYEDSLKEKEERLAITTRLAATGADTRQNVAIKQKERDVISANLEAAKAQLKVGQSELASLRNKLKQSELNAGRRSVTAKASGILVSLDAKVGSGISAYTPFATLAPDEELVLHGEIDERFASLVKP